MLKHPVRLAARALIAGSCLTCAASAQDPSTSSAESTTDPTSPAPGHVLQAGRAFRAGEAAFARGDYTEALRQFERANALAPRPATRFNIAVCLERLGRRVEAHRVLDTLARERDIDAVARERARSERERLGRQLARLEVRPSSPVREVRIAGEPCAQPCTAWVEPGRHAIELATERGITQRHLSLRAGEHRTVEVAIASRRATPPSTAGLAPGRARRTTAPRPAVVSWTGGALGVLGAAGFAYFGWRTHALHDRYVERPSQETRDDGLFARGAANVSLGVAALGIGLLIVDQLQRRGEPTSGATPSAQPVALQ